MSQQEQPIQEIPAIVQMAQTAVGYCQLMEQHKACDRDQLIQLLLQLIPQLYVAGLSLDDQAYDDNEWVMPYVTEQEYDYLYRSLEEVMGDDDPFVDNAYDQLTHAAELSAFKISEQLCDLYQVMGDFTQALAEDTDDERLREVVSARCKMQFRQYWGDTALRVLRALHQLHNHTEQDESIHDDFMF